ncbi:hypothetical protein FGB62_210g010 [Gracilaria domingensis]|nr:hypothetical protein FGB62_210g010 [Gracilaria domingensis]
MIQGHHSAALLLSAVTAHQTRLALLFALTQVPDILIAVLAFAFHVEKVRHSDRTTTDDHVLPFTLLYVPYSHGLWPNVAYSLLAARFLPGGRAQKATYALALFSHWLLDAASHVPDLDVCFPFRSGCPKAGLGLFRNVTLAVTLECCIVLIASAVYVMSWKRESVAIVARRVAPLMLVMLAFTMYYPFLQASPHVAWPVLVESVLFYSAFAAYAWFVERGLRDDHAHPAVDSSKRD